MQSFTDGIERKNGDALQKLTTDLTLFGIEPLSGFLPCQIAWRL
jgi:hypothetical protein